MAQYDEDGFLGGKIESWIGVHRRTYARTLSLAQELNRENHRFISGRPVSISNTYQLTVTVLFVRLMELYQALMVVIDRGMASPTRILFRAFLEAFFHLAAIHKDRSYLEEYLDQFDHERRTLVNRIRHSESAALEALRKPIDAELISEIEQIDARRVPMEQVAHRAGRHDAYLTAYTLLSSAVHSSPRDLEAHLDYDKTAKRIVGFKYGPTDAETARAVCLAGMTMAEALQDISNDFREDRSQLCDRIIKSFESLLPETEKDEP